MQTVKQCTEMKAERERQWIIRRFFTLLTDESILYPPGDSCRQDSGLTSSTHTDTADRSVECSSSGSCCHLGHQLRVFHVKLKEKSYTFTLLTDESILYPPGHSCRRDSGLTSSTHADTADRSVECSSSGSCCHLGMFSRKA